MHKIEIELEKRILILDGAMGTMVQKYQLEEDNYRNDFLNNHHIELKGNTDILNLTEPEIIRSIHLEYLKAGADIISTNTFGANAISQADYDTSKLVWDINKEGAILARNAIDDFMNLDSSQPRFVAGAIGPTTKLASMSSKMNDPGYRDITFDELVKAYTEQANALIEGGIDLFLLETITDTLNAKAAIFALMTIFEEIERGFPIMVSATITDQSGRVLSGQTLEAFMISISHAPILSIGLNCALGAEELRPYVQILNKESQFPISVHPNAGLPNEFGEYDQTVEEFSELILEFASNGWINIAGGCCGTTPQHIEVTANKLRNLTPRYNYIQSKSKKNQTTPAIKELINNWKNNPSNHPQPTFKLRELMDLVSKIEDYSTLKDTKSCFEKEQNKYHSEQAMLLNAHFFGRYQYLRVKNKLEIKAKLK